MIYQGLFNILSIYLNDIDLFYAHLDQYFQELINRSFDVSIIEKSQLDTKLNELISQIITRLKELGFESQELENKFLDPFVELDEIEHDKYRYISELYNDKVAPIVYELFLEKVVDYLADISVDPLMLKFKECGFLALEFIIELRNLKDLFEKNPEKMENLKKYITIQDNVIRKLSKNKSKIESLEELNQPKDKLQLLYLIYRIIGFFHLERRFDFSHIKDYIRNNVNEWLVTIPLVTLKNPDLYYCGLYLSKELKIPIDKHKVKNFLFELYEEGTDEFEAPLVEATDGLYYYLKSTNLMGVYLEQPLIDRLFETESKFFELNYLKSLETSQLVVILKLYNMLKISNVEQNIKAISDEIDERIGSEGIKQYREGFVSSEATYYVLFLNYMRNTLDKLKDFELLDSVISRIYRNLEILDFTADTNFDLISELFYSVECLKLFNCIETKQMIIHLAKFLFPSDVVNTIKSSQEIVKPKALFRHLKVNRLTGDTIY